jgi:hypothetical protein
MALVTLSPDPFAQMRVLAQTIEATIGNDVLVQASGKNILTWMLETLENLTDADIAAAKYQPSLDRIIAALRHRTMHHPGWDADAKQ